MQIRVLYIITGAILVAKMSECDEQGFHVLEEPREIVPAVQDGKIAGFKFIPYGSLQGALPGLKACSIHASHFLHEPLEFPLKFQDAYMSAISGIQIAR